MSREDGDAMQNAEQTYREMYQEQREAQAMSREGAAAKEWADLFVRRIQGEINLQTHILDYEDHCKFTEELQSALDAAYAEGLREAAKAARNHCRGYDIDWWMGQTKKGAYTQACLAVAEDIERLAQRKEGRDE
jgi:hypothetical protein